MAAAPLSPKFLAQLDDEVRDGFASVADLEERLQRAIAQARDAHPDIALDEEPFLQHLAKHMLGSEPVDGFEHLHAADLWLALGCATGDRAALQTFGVVHGPDVDGALRRFRNVPTPEDDMRQVLHEKLFVGKAGQGPKIADYAGQGFLQNWVRITAVRTFTDMARRANRNKETPEEDLMQLADGEDLELSFLKQHYRAAFKRSFEEAVQGLTASERNMLRHSVVKGQSIDQIAQLYAIHRATAARRVSKAREALLSKTRQSLMERLEIGREEFDSLMQLIRSRMDVSINRVLGSQSERPSKIDRSGTDPS